MRTVGRDEMAAVLAVAEEAGREIMAIYADEARWQRIVDDTVAREGRIEVVSAASGKLFFEGKDRRYLQLNDGHQIEGPADGGKGYRLATFARNDVAMPDGAQTRQSNDPELLPTSQLIGDCRHGLC